MKKKFPCPRCGRTAYYFGGYTALCWYYGALLYTEIPRKLIDEYKKNKKNKLPN